MIGDTEVLIAAAQSGLCHRLKCVETVRALRMRMEDSSDIAIGDKLRQCSGESSGHFATALAQLPGHRLHAKRSIDAVLAGSRNELATALSAAMARKPARCASEPVARSNVMP
jgi:hypothetical protein